MVGCSVSGCQSRSEYKNPEISFHSFPLDPILRKQWIFATGRTNWVPSKFARICSVHFKASQIVIKNKNKKVVEDAVPKEFVHLLTSTSVDTISYPIMCTAKRYVECPETSVSKKQCLTFPSTSKCTNQFVMGGTTKQHQECSDTSDSKKQNELPQTATSRGPMISKDPKPLLDDIEASASKRHVVTSMEVSPRAPLSPRKRKMLQKITKMQQRSRLLNKKLRAVRQSRRRFMKKSADLKSVLDELKCNILIGSEDLDILETIGEGNADIIKAVLDKAKPKKYSEAIRKFIMYAVRFSE